MTATPRRTLTVADGRNTIGFIHEMSCRNFVAVVAGSGQKLGPFATQAEAALAIRAAREAGQDKVLQVATPSGRPAR